MSDSPVLRTAETSKQPMLFLQWFVEQYECGLPDPSVISNSLAYLEGIMAASPQQFAAMEMAANALRSFEVMVRTLKQYQVRMPYG